MVFTRKDKFFTITEAVVEIVVTKASEAEAEIVADRGEREAKTEPDDVDMVLPGKVDPQKNRFPYCIVWTPIPLLTYDNLTRKILRIWPKNNIAKKWTRNRFSYLFYMKIWQELL